MTFFRIFEEFLRPLFFRNGLKTLPKTHPDQRNKSNFFGPKIFRSDFGDRFSNFTCVRMSKTSRIEGYFVASGSGSGRK